MARRDIEADRVEHTRRRAASDPSESSLYVIEGEHRAAHIRYSIGVEISPHSFEHGIRGAREFGPAARSAIARPSCRDHTDLGDELMIRDRIAAVGAHVG
jgi:hypothetical protein